MKIPPFLRALGWLALAVLAAGAPRAHASPAAAGQVPAAAAVQDPASIQALAEDYLRKRLSHLPGHAEIAFEPLRRQDWEACQAMSAFLPSGMRPRPRMTVGVRCTAPSPWTAYLQASVSVPGTYYVASMPLSMGQTVKPEHLAPRSGDLLRLPLGAIVEPDQAIGRSTTQRVAAGQPLRQTALRHAEAVLRGHTVKLMARGPGFMVSSEGQAMDNAAPGSTVQVRTASGQVISGVVQDAGTVEIQL